MNESDDPARAVVASVSLGNAPLRLFHVSEQGGIDRFEPRVAAGAGAAGPSLVWAVDFDHLPNYVLPRDCPRVCFRPAAETTAADRTRFFPSSSYPVVVIEAGWLERAEAAVLRLYELPPSGFQLQDANAGYFVSTVAVKPLVCRRIERPVRELATLGAELRVVTDLSAMAAMVARSSISFSCIRMRHRG
jgi:hypothetical protein